MEKHTGQKVLTISIPTWNRSFYLKELLEQLTSQVIKFKLENKIELLISNNNSEDDTEEFVNSLKEKFEFITYNRNRTNIGAKANVIKAMELASSEFVLILGDDDRIRADCLEVIVTKLELLENPGILIDLAFSKVRSDFAEGELSLKLLIEKFYWYIGNAGFFIVRSQFIKEVISKYDYGMFNECWPQTQIMILSITNHPEYRIYIHKLNIHSNSLHGEVMVYTSFYLWRTCYLELARAINSIRQFVDAQIYDAARVYLKRSILQQLYNILQCGIFIDDAVARRKTRSSIISNLSLFYFYEKCILIFISIILLLPLIISRPIANIFILFLKGLKGIRKKNDFVNFEMKKMSNMKERQSGPIRFLVFEKDN